MYAFIHTCMHVVEYVQWCWCAELAAEEAEGGEEEEGDMKEGEGEGEEGGMLELLCTIVVVI